MGTKSNPLKTEYFLYCYVSQFITKLNSIKWENNPWRCYNDIFYNIIKNYLNILRKFLQWIIQHINICHFLYLDFLCSLRTLRQKRRFFCFLCLIFLFVTVWSVLKGHTFSVSIKQGISFPHIFLKAFQNSLRYIYVHNCQGCFGIWLFL